MSENNILVSKEARQSLLMEREVVSNLRKRLFDVKPRGGAPREQINAYKIIKSTLSETPLLGRKSSLRGIMKKYFSVRSGIPQILRKDWWKCQPRRKRKDRLREEDRRHVVDFFLSPEISREVPCKKDALKQKGSDTGLIQKNLMTLTLAEAFQEYKNRYPTKRNGLTAFKKLKPMNVKKSFGDTQAYMLMYNMFKCCIKS